MTRKLPISVRPEDFKIIIEKTPKKDIEARVAFLLAYGSGMRISEVKKCRKEHFSGNAIEIRCSKYGVDRIVPIPKGWKKWMYDVLPIKKSIRSLERNFKSAVRKAGLNPKYVFHGLRHGFATRLINSGVPANQVQLLLGHSNLATTSIYTKAAPVDALKNYEDLF